MPYANGGTSSQLQQGRDVETTIEQLSSINESAVKQLYEAKGGLQLLLNKIRGSQPEPELPGPPPGGYLIATAHELRSLANDIARQVGELHRVIGQDK